MLMKSLFDKAAEYGSKAKILAGGYLQGDKSKKSPEIEEIEKSYSEKFQSLKKEIETFQNDTMRNCEDKINHLNELVSKLNTEKKCNTLPPNTNTCHTLWLYFTWFLIKKIVPIV